MSQSAVLSCWAVTPERGFLMAEEPVTDPTAFVPPECRDALREILQLAENLPTVLDSGDGRAQLARLPELPAGHLTEVQSRAAAERLHQLYGFLANAYLWAPNAPATRRLPANLARPFVAVSNLVDRPPVVSYADSQLCNWRLVDPDAGYTPENMQAIQRFQSLDDEEWFWIIHCAIEAAGGAALYGSKAAVTAAQADDAEGLVTALIAIAGSLHRVNDLAKRMEENCRPDVFYHTLRPYLFSPEEGILFEGVAAFGDRPQAYLGQTAAQSTLIPAVAGSLGIRHRETDLTGFLAAVRAYMPVPHQQFVQDMEASGVRAFVHRNRGTGQLLAQYNDCVQLLIDFRKHHLTLAANFIASKVDNPRGTGGTEFMRWLKIMTRETEAQLL